MVNAVAMKSTRFNCTKVFSLKIIVERVSAMHHSMLIEGMLVVFSLLLTYFFSLFLAIFSLLAIRFLLVVFSLKNLIFSFILSCLLSTFTEFFLYSVLSSVYSQ